MGAGLHLASALLSSSPVALGGMFETRGEAL